MKKPLFIAIVFLLTLATLIPVYADIYNWTWLGTTYTGWDEYYDDYVNAYESGTTAVLAVTVRNTDGHNITVTSVYVNMDWDDTHKSTQVNATNTETLDDGEVRVFFVDFKVSNTTVASNLFTHSYTIIVEYFFYPNASDPSLTKTGKYTEFGDDFVVYSADQADARDLIRIINRFSPPSPYGWSSVRAQILWNRAANETSNGEEYYRRGDFYEAKQHFSAALDHINQAWNAEEAYLTVQEELNIRQIEANIKNLDSMANFFNGLSTMWILFGIGGILFGIGYIIKWSVHARRHSKPEASA
jgi:tetratricopeptide (TPR) repeat protein